MASMAAWMPESPALDLADRCQRLRKKSRSEMLWVNVEFDRQGDDVSASTFPHHLHSRHAIGDGDEVCVPIGCIGAA
jgi:hypothetical protein